MLCRAREAGDPAQQRVVATVGVVPVRSREQVVELVRRATRGARRYLEAGLDQPRSCQRHHETRLGAPAAEQISDNLNEEVAAGQSLYVWREEFETLEQARQVIGAYIDGYHHRPHSGLAYRTPREVAATWKDHDDQLTPAA